MQREGISTLYICSTLQEPFCLVYVNALLLSLLVFDWGDEKRIVFIVFGLDKVVDFMPTYL